MSENESSSFESSRHSCNCITHNGIGEAREKHIKDCLFDSDGYVNWEHFGIIDQYCGEDEIHYAISLLLKNKIFDEKEGYALYREDGMIKPTERFWGEILYFTDEKHALNFSKEMRMEIDEVRLDHTAYVQDDSVHILRAISAILKLS